jgi:hypothetical protein
MRKILLTCLLSLSTLLAWGTALGEADARQFDIEVVIFAHINAYDGGEHWPRESRREFPPGGWESRPLPEPGVADMDWQALPGSGSQLAGVTAALRRSDSYRPLVHLYWRQGLVDPARTRAIDIASLAGTLDSGAVPRVEGTLRLSVARYLHLETDIRLVDGEAGQFMDEALPSYRMRQSRRMRSGELHYLDHPRFGLIALITPHTPGD